MSTGIQNSKLLKYSPWEYLLKDLNYVFEPVILQIRMCLTRIKMCYILYILCIMNIHTMLKFDVSCYAFFLVIHQLHSCENELRIKIIEIEET